MNAEPPILQVEGLKKHFPVHRGLLSRIVAQVKAVDGVSFELGKGEILCLVGESGCGKSTVGRLVTRLLEPTEGSIRLEGEDISHLDQVAMRPYRREVQIVFQDPYASLNPRLTVGGIIGEPLENFGLMRGKKKLERVEWLLDRVGLRPEVANRYPHEFSGGQRQRLGIARALALNPKLIVADEPVSALDVSVQAQVLNLLIDLQRDLGLSYLFISHDLAVVEHIGHRIAVMYLGRIVELAPKRQLFDAPMHPYTQALLSAAPIPDPRARRDKLVIEGDVPSPMAPPPGCHFHTRCPYAEERCWKEVPALRELGPDRVASCHFAEAIAAGRKAPTAAPAAA